MKIALVQTNPTIGDFDANAGEIVQYCDAALQQGCELAVFPELAIPGYPPKDLLETTEFIDANLACLEQLIGTIRGIGVICGYVDRNRTGTGKPIHNSAVLFEDGRVLQRVNKQLLPTYDVFDERRYFEPGSGSSTFFYKGSRIGLTICEDAWNDEDIFSHRFYDKDPVERLAQDGADLLINISASVYHMGKHDFRGHMLGAIAKKYRAPLVYVNQVGGNDGLLFDGISTTFDRRGGIAIRARDFEEDLVVFDTETPDDAQPPEQTHPVSPSDVASVTKALAMGTRDYVIKCGFQRVVVGLSGGIDSALTAAIAVEALGSENVSVVFMPSQYTSRENYEDTRQLADNLNIELAVIPIDDMFGEFIRHLSPDFDPADPGVTEQNIQARIRGTILMAHSNRQGSLVLSTGNKSELAVGYCTLYGDMTGGLAVISDVPKALVYEISRFFNREREVIPLRIIEKAPSAELKPDQTDQDDLPPYEVLDPILKAYIEDLKRVDEIVALGFERDTVLEVITRVDRNEYKRQQAAPGLKVTSKAFGYGRRYPLAQRFRRA